MKVARRSQRHSFALTYAFDEPTGAFTITGHKSSYTYNLSSLITQVHNSNNAIGALEWWDSIQVEAKTGDHDGINLPGFSHADSALLYWEIHRDVATLPLWITIWKGLWKDPTAWVEINPDGARFVSACCLDLHTRREMFGGIFT